MTRVLALISCFFVVFTAHMVHVRNYEAAVISGLVAIFAFVVMVALHVIDAIIDRVNKLKI